jgi:hypothetical protein
MTFDNNEVGAGWTGSCFVGKAPFCSAHVRFSVSVNSAKDSRIATIDSFLPLSEFDENVNKIHFLCWSALHFEQDWLTVNVPMGQGFRDCDST